LNYELHKIRKWNGKDSGSQGTLPFYSPILMTLIESNLPHKSGIHQSSFVELAGCAEMYVVSLTVRKKKKRIANTLAWVFTIIKHLIKNHKKESLGCRQAS
jgi:hypothetical protein